MSIEILWSFQSFKAFPTQKENIPTNFYKRQKLNNVATISVAEQFSKQLRNHFEASAELPEARVSTSFKTFNINRKCWKHNKISFRSRRLQLANDFYLPEALFSRLSRNESFCLLLLRLEFLIREYFYFFFNILLSSMGENKDWKDTAKAKASRQMKLFFFFCLPRLLLLLQWKKCTRIEQ